MTLWTGLGLSISTATYLRWMLLFLCVASLFFLIVGSLDRVGAICTAHHDVTLAGVAGAAREAAGLQATDGLDRSPGASSFGGDFNADFSVGLSEEQQLRDGGIEYNYRLELAWKGGGEGSHTFAAMSGTDAATYVRERPGMSAFALEDGAVYHTYSTYSRGLDTRCHRPRSGSWPRRPPSSRSARGQ